MHFSTLQLYMAILQICMLCVQICIGHSQYEVWLHSTDLHGTMQTLLLLLFFSENSLSFTGRISEKKVQATLTNWVSITLLVNSTGTHLFKEPALEPEKYGYYELISRACANDVFSGNGEVLDRRAYQVAVRLT